MPPRETKKQDTRFDRAVGVFKRHGGMLRTTQALRAGVHPSTLYAMRDSGMLEVLSRGVYRLADNSPLGNPDLVTVATRVPSGVICLISTVKRWPKRLKKHLRTEGHRSPPSRRSSNHLSRRTGTRRLNGWGSSKRPSLTMLPNVSGTSSWMSRPSSNP
jgi:hypothetical protein